MRALSILKESIMAQRANPEEISQPLHDAYACLLANGLDGEGEALRILANVVLAH
jgi:putative transposase